MSETELSLQTLTVSVNAFMKLLIYMCCFHVTDTLAKQLGSVHLSLRLAHSRGLVAASLCD